jgi:hypothetical protein
MPQLFRLNQYPKYILVGSFDPTSNGSCLSLEQTPSNKLFRVGSGSRILCFTQIDILRVVYVPHYLTLIDDI